jgi:hypothetical protein
MNSIATRLGFWSSCLAAIAFLIFTACFIIIAIRYPLFFWTDFPAYVTYTRQYDRTLVYIAQACMLCFGPLYLIMLSSLYDYVPAPQRILVRVALTFAVVFATTTAIHYFMQISVVRLNLAQGELEGLEHFLQARPYSAISAVNMVGWTLFFGVSSLFVAQVFNGSQLARTICWLFVANGLFCLAAGIGYLFDAQLLLFVTINLGMGGAVTALTILLSFYFRRAALAEAHE